MEEYGPKIIYIRGIHNTVADTVSGLEYNPMFNPTNEYTHAMLGVSLKEMSMQRSGKATMNAMLTCKLSVFQ